MMGTKDTSFKHDWLKNENSSLLATSHPCHKKDAVMWTKISNAKNKVQERSERWQASSSSNCIFILFTHYFMHWYTQDTGHDITKMTNHPPVKPLDSQNEILVSVQKREAVLTTAASSLRIKNASCSSLALPFWNLPKLLTSSNNSHQSHLLQCTTLANMRYNTGTRGSRYYQVKLPSPLGSLRHSKDETCSRRATPHFCVVC